MFERLVSYFCSDPYPVRHPRILTLWLTPDARFIGRCSCYYDGNRVAWGFWWFSVELVRRY